MPDIDAILPKSYCAPAADSPSGARACCLHYLANSVEPLKCSRRNGLVILDFGSRTCDQEAGRKCLNVGKAAQSLRLVLRVISSRLQLHISVHLHPLLVCAWVFCTALSMRRPRFFVVDVGIGNTGRWCIPWQSHETEEEERKDDARNGHEEDGTGEGRHSPHVHISI